MKSVFKPSTEPDFGAYWFLLNFLFKCYCYYINKIKKNYTWDEARLAYSSFIIPWMNYMVRMCPSNCEWLQKGKDND